MTFEQLKELLIQLMSWIQEKAPLVWGIARQKTIADAVVCTVTTLIFILLGIVMLIITKRIYDSEDDNMIILFPILGIIICVLVVVFAGAETIKGWVALDYYTILNITALIK